LINLSFPEFSQHFKNPEAKDLQEQSSIYLKERNLAMRLKRMREEMLLAGAA